MHDRPGDGSARPIQTRKGKTGRMSNKLEQLKTMTTVVADTGDLDAIAQWAA